MYLSYCFKILICFVKAEDGRGEYLERIARYNTVGLELCENLRELKIVADDTVDTITQLSK